MLEPEQVPVMIKILKDYLDKDRKKQYVPQATKLLKDLEEDRIERRQEKRKRSIRISKKELAREFGMDQQTLMKNIHGNDDLFDALILMGYQRFQKGFWPAQAKLVRDYFHGRITPEDLKNM